MDLSELIKQQGLIVPPTPTNPDHVDSKVNPKKKLRPIRRPWLEEENQHTESSLPSITEDNKETAFSVSQELEVNGIKSDGHQTLDKRESDVSQTLVRRKIDASYPLEALPPQASNVRQELDKCESDARQTLDKQKTDVIQALGRRESGVSQTLETLPPQSSDARQALDKTIDSRKTAVSQTLDNQKTDVSNHAKETLEISHLFGNEKTLVLYACEECRKVGSLETNYISNEEITSKITIDSNGLRNLIHRVKQKGYFTVKTKSLGKTAIRKFTVPQYIYKQIPLKALDRRESNASQTLDIRESSVSQTLGTPLGTPLDSYPSTSSDLYTSTTTTSPNPDKKCTELPQDWKDLDYTCLSSIGFKECHLLQIFESGKSSPEMVQESIYELAHDLKAGSHGMRSPLLVILKQLRSKGEPYSAITPGYVSDQVRYERKKLEELKRRESEVKSLQEQQQEILNQNSIQQEEQEFEDWMKTKTEDEIKTFAGSFNPNFPSGKAMLKNAFRAEKELIRSQVEKSLSN